MGRFFGYLLVLALVAFGAALYSQTEGGLRLPFFGPGEDDGGDGIRTEWLEELHSRNPREQQAATARVKKLGEGAIPVLRVALSEGDRERRRAALQAVVILEQTSAPLIPEVAQQLRAGDVTEEAAMALSFMGPDAFGPLRDALRSRDPAVRREAIRSIGKLTSRAPLDAGQVTPLLVAAMKDPAHSVRAVAATYLGIIHQNSETAVPALVAGLEDPSIEVRRASAAALGSFGAGAEPAIAALRKAAGDEDPDLAREAGRALIKIRSPEGGQVP